MGWINEKIGGNAAWLKQTAQDIGSKAGWLHENVLKPASHVARQLGELQEQRPPSPPPYDEEMTKMRARKKSRRR